MAQATLLWLATPKMRAVLPSSWPMGAPLCGGGALLVPGATIGRTAVPLRRATCGRSDGWRTVYRIGVSPAILTPWRAAGPERAARGQASGKKWAITRRRGGAVATHRVARGVTQRSYRIRVKLHRYGAKRRWGGRRLRTAGAGMYGR